MVIVDLFPCYVLVGSHVSLAWVELLVLEALIRKMLWNPSNILGLVTSLGSLGWTNALEALGALSY